MAVFTMVMLAVYSVRGYDGKQSPLYADPFPRL